MGVNCMKTVMPTAATLPESWRTSQSIAMRCIQTAVLATRLLAANRR